MQRESIKYEKYKLIGALSQLIYLKQFKKKKTLANGKIMPVVSGERFTWNKRWDYRDPRT